VFFILLQGAFVMNAIRGLISVFILILIALEVAGWVWAGGQPTFQMQAGSRVALTCCALAGVVGLIALWRRAGTSREASGM
jgi:ammonia channel protein AmtB